MNWKGVEFFDRVFVRRPFFGASAYRVDGLREVLATQVFQNAVWLASPEFYRELEKKGFDVDLLGGKERLTALKFYNRMSFRATPFGAFSGFGLAGWGDGDAQRKVVDKGAVLHLLPSVQLELEGLESRPLTAGVLVAVNPTLYQLGSGWRYSRYEVSDKGKLSFFVYLLAHDPADELLLAYLAGGPLPLGDLVVYLVGLTDCTDEEAEAHIARLVEEQVLVTEYALSLLGSGPFAEPVSVEYNESLSLPGFISGGVPGLERVMDGKSVYAGLELRDPVGLPAGLQQEIMEALKVLDCLAPAPPKNNIDRFREAFEAKFAERRVPLLEALDPDLGVPFDEELDSEEHELLKGLEFGQVQKNDAQLTWTPAHGLLMKAWLQNTKREKWEPVVLTADDLFGFPGNDLPFPPSASVFCSLAGDKVVFQNIGGATANALTGRFSAFSEDFEMFCRSVALLEEGANPDVLFAEVEQVSHRRIDNINRRKQVYGRVIPLNCFPPEGAVLPKDVDVLVRGGEVMLVHRPSGKRVIPRLPTAFNYHHNEMPLFRFLCALQFKSIRANFDFDPEKYFPGLDFYPRVEYGKTVLSLARWHLSGDEIDGLVCRPFSISRLHLFCRERGIPPGISVGRADRQLVFDLSDDWEAVFFLESLKDQVNPVITEFPGIDAKSPGGRGGFNEQFVLSLMNRETVYPPVPVPAEAVGIVRDFEPGSEWIYMKIYATAPSLEAMLIDTLLPWIMESRHRFRQWFFVRYHDTGTHLRLRLRVNLPAVKELQYELQSLVMPLRTAGLVQKAYFDTYQREIERYSANLIGDVEDVFYRGSEWVAARLARTMDAEEGSGLLWPVVHCYQMITAFFDEDAGEVVSLCEWCAAAFFQEHGGDKILKRSMDERYRDLRPALSAAIMDSSGGEISEVLEVCLRRLSAAAAENGINRRKLIADMVHMQINRIFKAGQRRHEAFIWHCLLKMAVSRLKRLAQKELQVMNGH